MDRRPAAKPGPDLRPATAERNDSFDTVTDSDRAGAGVESGVTGASVDTLYDLGLPPDALADDVEDAELQERGDDDAVVLPHVEDLGAAFAEVDQEISPFRPDREDGQSVRANFRTTDLAVVE